MTDEEFTGRVGVRTSRERKERRRAAAGRRLSSGRKLMVVGGRRREKKRRRRRGRKGEGIHVRGTRVCPCWRRKEAKLMRVVEENRLIVCVFHGIRLLSFVIVTGKTRGGRRN
jgi:hypothetical protein